MCHSLAVEQPLDRLTLGETGEAAHRGQREARDPGPLDVVLVSPQPLSPRDTLLEALRHDGLVIGEVTLASGRAAQHYVDARRAPLRPAAFRATGELVAHEARRLGVVAVGGPTLGADPRCLLGARGR